MRYHLAQLNIGRFRAPLDEPVMAGFRTQLDPINALADRAAGFVWRLQTDEGNATAIRPYAADDMMAINLSVWESLESLQAFVYAGPHRDVLRDRKLWFEPQAGPIAVLWWIPAGTLPTVEEAQARLDHLARLGPTPHAFTFAKPFPAPSPRGAMIRHIAPQFFSTDLPATLSYYKDKLGFDCLGTWLDPPVYAIVGRDQHRIHFRCAEPPAPNPDKYADELLDAYLSVDDADALYAEYAARGVEFTRPLGDTAWQTREFVVKDGDGRLLAFGASLE